jgi:hypothetical protein
VHGQGSNQYQTRPSPPGPGVKAAGRHLLIQASQPADWVEQHTAALREPSTPPETFLQLSGNKNSRMRYEVAVHETCPPDVLVALNQDDSPSVRNGAAANPATPPEALQSLSRDPNQWIRWTVTQRSDCPPELLQQMLEDTEIMVARAAAEHPALPRHIRAMWQLAH